MRCIPILTARNALSKSTFFAGDEKSAKKGIAKLYRDKPHEVIATETIEQKYGMSVETFITNAEPID